jgi:hypothetical protein
VIQGDTTQLFSVNAAQLAEWNKKLDK